MKSATPNKRLVVSAKATPTDFNLAGEASVTGTVANFIAITIGEDVISELLKRRSSTACRFPGEAYMYHSAIN